MTRSRTRSPFQTETSSPADGLEDKSADHGLEVKDLADDDEDEGRAFDAILEPEGFVPPETLTAGQVIDLAASPDVPGAEVLSSDEPAGTVIDTVPVVMIHHYKEHVPGKTVVLDQRTATGWVTAHIARWPEPDEQG